MFVFMTFIFTFPSYLHKLLIYLVSINCWYQEYYANSEEVQKVNYYFGNKDTSNFNWGQLPEKKFGTLNSRLSRDGTSLRPNRVFFF
jgi:hypothetical protein